MINLASALLSNRCIFFIICCIFASSHLVDICVSSVGSLFHFPTVKILSELMISDKVHTKFFTVA